MWEEVYTGHICKVILIKGEGSLVGNLLNNS